MRPDGDRPCRFWPRAASRGGACADETAQAVAVSLRLRWCGFSDTVETGCAGDAAQSVRSDGDRSFGFGPRTAFRGGACADETAQAVAVTFRLRWCGFSDTVETGCAGDAAQAVRSDGDRSFGFWPRTSFRGSACAGESAQAVAVARRPVSCGS